MRCLLFDGDAAAVVVAVVVVAEHYLLFVGCYDGVADEVVVVVLLEMRWQQEQDMRG